MKDVMRRSAIVGLAALSVGLRAPLAQTDYERMTAGIRHTGIAIGNAHVCTGPDGKAAFLEEAHHMFDLILQDVGSELA